MSRRISRATSAKRESKYVEFKERFAVKSGGEWCELLKDFAAIANSGGGVIVVGVNNIGQPVGADVSAIVGMDPVMLSDKLHKYTDAHFADFQIHAADKDGYPLALIEVGPAFPPIVFTKPGT